MRPDPRSPFLFHPSPTRDVRDEYRAAVARGVFLQQPLIAARDTSRTVEQRIQALKATMPTSPMVAEPVRIDDTALSFELEFAFGSIDTYGTIIYASAFEAGAPMRFITSHEWNSTYDAEIGAGRVGHQANQRSDSLDAQTASLRGRLIGPTTSDSTLERFATVYNALVAEGIQPEVSVGFFILDQRYHPDLLYDHEDPEVHGLTEDEMATGAWAAIDGADGVEVSSVYRGAVPGTTMRLSNGSDQPPSRTPNLAAARTNSQRLVRAHRTKQVLHAGRKRAMSHANPSRHRAHQSVRAE